MKCCVRVLVLAFVLQLTNAAPPFDAFLDELLEMNIRMGDVIRRAKYEYKQSMANDFSDLSDSIVIHSTELNESATKHDTEFNKPFGEMYNEQKGGNDGSEKDAANGTFESKYKSNDDDSQSKYTFDGIIVKPKSGEEIDEKTENVKRSFIGPAVDTFGGSQWDNRKHEVDYINTTNGSDNGERVHRPDQENISTNSSLDNPETHVVDGTYRKSFESDTVVPNNNDLGNTDADNDKINGAEQEHPEHVWGEETSNNEKKDGDDGNWFGNTIDAIVNFFS